MMWEGAKKFYHESINSAKRKGVSARIVRECANLINRIPLKKNANRKISAINVEGELGIKFVSQRAFFVDYFWNYFNKKRVN